MRLVNYGMGELADRLSILALKILIGREKGVDVRHFQAEQRELIRIVWRHSPIPTTLCAVAAVCELAAVNGQLWQAEDDLRALRREKTHGSSTSAEHFMEVAICIQVLNDRRAELIQQINHATGERLGAEKL